MSRKSRLLRIVLVVLFVLVFAGYFAFSTFLFNPFEGGLGVDVAALAPRDVDFFVARAELKDVFGDFPELEIEEELEANETYRVWKGSPEAAAFYQEIGLADAVRSLEEVSTKMPLGMAPLDIAGGRDLAIAGTFDGPELADAQWAVYATVNWMGKLAIEGLPFSSLHGLEDQGILVDASEGVAQLSGAGLPRPLYVGRVRDVAIIATGKSWIDAAYENRGRQYQDSLFQRALYADHVANVDRNRERDEVEFLVNTRAMFEALGTGDAWPDADSQVPGEKFASRFFRSGMLNRVVGIASFDDGLSIDMHGELSSELMTAMQERNYRLPGADQSELRDRILPYVPQDTALLIYGKARPGDLLSTTLEVMEPAMRDLIADTLKDSGRYPKLDELVAELDGALKNRFALIVRENDYPVGENDPPNDGRPVFAAALLTWMDDPSVIEELRDTIGRMGKRIGLQPIKPEHSSGYYRNRVGGYTQFEYTSPAIPGTGVIVTQNTPDGICIVSNSVYMLNHLLKTSTQGAPQFPRLTDRVDFVALLDDSLPQAQFTLWADPRESAGTMRQMSRRWAEDSIVIDWRVERAKVEAEVLREHFPGQRQGSLTTAVQAEVDALVDPKLDALKERIYAEQVPVLQAETERRITYAEAARAVLLRLHFTQKTVDMSLRVVAPLD